MGRPGWSWGLCNSTPMERMSDTEEGPLVVEFQAIGRV